MIENALWAIAFLVVCILPMLIRPKGEPARIFDPKHVFLLYLGLQIGVTGLVTIFSQESTEIGVNPITHADTYTRVFLIAIGGVLAFHAGNWLIQTRWRPTQNRFTGKFDLKRATWMYGTATGFGYLMFLVFLQTHGGLASFLTDREGFRSTLEGEGTLMAPFSIIAPFSALGYAIARLSSTATKNDLYWAIGAVLITLPPIFLLGFRVLLIPPILLLAAVIHLRYRPLPLRNIGIAGTILIVVLSAFGFQRNFETARQYGINFQWSMLNAKLLSRQVFTRSMGAEVTATTIEQLDHTGEYASPFDGVIEAATILIPHQVWAEKPEPVIVRFGTTFFGSILAERDDSLKKSYSGVSPTPIAEYYWLGGPAAVVVAMFCLGVAAGALHRFYLSNPGSDRLLLLFLVAYWAVAYSAEAPQLALNGLVTNGVMAGAIALAMRSRR